MSNDQRSKGARDSVTRPSLLRRLFTTQRDERCRPQPVDEDTLEHRLHTELNHLRSINDHP